ncbi:MAG: DUF4910 domain-containing protein [Flavobacteriales bacterium]|nr:DUF4910 domain-containing protein [Flavobacteriales bacterium]MDG1780233.1 DUF4910 domain-containing protein [Flavobacteriales bacterium]MDG2247395.1 DUF4910 domain-containing protein [Flavobacteriales bacterium]
MPSTELEKDLESYFDRLWPICRSLTGDGVRETLAILQEVVPMELFSVASGSTVFDWTVPKEWNINEAYILDPSGQKIIDFKENNLHVFSYSTPVNTELTFEELNKHLRTLPAMPTAIPYVTSYYREQWGFCLSHEQWESLPREGNYRVVIDSSLTNGELNYGECVLPGETDKEILFSTYVCHPSMANNELSGPLAQAFLYKEIAKLKNRKYTYRFVFAPETIGIIAYLDRVGDQLLKNLEAGYVLTCVGDRGPLTYKRSKQGQSVADRTAEHVLKHSEKTHEIIDFAVGGSDERQYCSPGFNLPVGSLMRTPYQRYKEYHTSLDNKEFISFSHLADTISTYMDIVKVFELNEPYENKVKFGEPQLGERGLYPDSINPDTDRENLHNLLHFLSFADGQTDLITIAEARNRSALVFEEAIKNCQAKGLI